MKHATPIILLLFLLSGCESLGDKSLTLTTDMIEVEEESALNSAVILTISSELLTDYVLYSKPERALVIMSLVERLHERVNALANDTTSSWAHTDRYISTRALSRDIAEAVKRALPGLVVRGLSFRFGLKITDRVAKGAAMGKDIKAMIATRTEEEVFLLLVERIRWNLDRLVALTQIL